MAIHVDVHRKLENFELDITINSKSRRIGILGESGCGKSMTLRSIAGVEPVDSGRIVIDDNVVFDSEHKINIEPGKRRVGYLFQNYALFPSMTVSGNIAAGLKGSKTLKNERVNEMIRKFGLEGLEKRYPSELSGGQQQRTALARLMAYKPDVILLDEPFSALDIFLKDKMQQELIKMLSDYEGTVILVSHSRDEIYRFSDELYIIGRGHNICSGKTKDVFKDPVYADAARLTGCKNIAKARLTGETKVYVPDWDVELTIEAAGRPESEEAGRTFSEASEGAAGRLESEEAGRTLSGAAEEAGAQGGWSAGRRDISAVGVRAHDFVPIWGERRRNCIPVQVTDIAHLPFEDHYYIKTAGGREDIVWAVQRELLGAIEEKGLPSYLMLEEKSVLLLK